MPGLLLRLGVILIVGDALYLAGAEAFAGGADAGLFRTVLGAGAACLAGGGVLRLMARARAGIVARSCPRCGRRVARGRVYCEDHRAEAINEYRDRERQRGA